LDWPPGPPPTDSLLRIADGASLLGYHQPQGVPHPPIDQKNLPGLLARFRALNPHSQGDGDDFNALAAVAALDGHLHAHGLKKEREGGPAAPAIIQQCPLFHETVIMADVRALSRREREQYASLSKRMRIVKAGNPTLIADLEADPGFVPLSFVHLYDRFEEVPPCEGDDDEAEPDERVDERGGRSDFPAREDNTPRRLRSKSR